MNALMSAEEILALGDRKTIIVDATFYVPGTGGDANAEYLERHIRGARRFDVEAIADPTSSLPHMLPNAEDFSRAVASLGIDDDTLVVAYDAKSPLGAARAWWMFRVFGHENVRVLDGGLDAWTAAGGPVEAGSAHTAQSGIRFTATLDGDRIRDKRSVLTALSDPSTRVIDARGAARFRGEAPEPRPGVRAGHMPGARNLPWNELIGVDGRYLSAADLRARIGSEGYSLVTTCGSGVSACVIALAAEHAGLGQAAVYDGSWAEWGADSALPIATGPVPAGSS